MDQQNFRVLIHPDRDAHQLAIWSEWQQGQCKTLSMQDVKRMETLQDVAYISSLEDGTRIILGGQEADACVYLHAATLLTDTEFIRKTLSLVVDASATKGNIDAAVAAIQRKFGKLLCVINQNVS